MVLTIIFAYGKNLKQYDVNSLYPFSMLKPMPLNLIKEHKYLDLELDQNSNLFGIFEAECIVPKCDRPQLPFKLGGRTIYPYGNWRGIYFTEEIKALLEYGYKFKLIKGYEFSQYDLFKEYVNYFYNIKMSSSGSTKFIAKMHLNQLYGIFGKKQDIIETINIYNRDIKKYIATKIVKTIIEINSDKSCILLNNNIDNKILKELNIELETNLISRNVEVTSNVAIAAAITSYSRIQMLKYKLDPNTLYTDTDSIFTSVPLDESLVDQNKIGFMKDELNGCTISEGYFLGIKQYGYYYIE